jgi:hypothetical protein
MQAPVVVMSECGRLQGWLAGSSHQHRHPNPRRGAPIWPQSTTFQHHSRKDGRRLKMLLDPMGGIVLTNDGHAILREIEVAHPAAKSMIELSRTQDEEVGDGTTTVIILGMHP